MNYIFSYKTSSSENQIETASLEDGKAWVSIMCPDLFTGVDWNKIKEGDVLTVQQQLTITASTAKPEQSDPEV